MKITFFEKASLVAIRAEFLKLVFSNLFNPKLTLLLTLISMHMSNKDFLNSTRSSLFESFKSWQLSYLHSFCLTYSGHQQFSEFWNNLPDFTFLHQLFQNSSLKFLHTILWRATLALRIIEVDLSFCWKLRKSGNVLFSWYNIFCKQASCK